MTDIKNVKPEGNRGSLEFSADVDWFLGMLKVIRSVSDEVSLHFDAEGIIIKSVNCGHTTMLVNRIPAKCFKSYKVSAGKVGIDVDNLIGILSALRGKTFSIKWFDIIKKVKAFRKSRRFFQATESVVDINEIILEYNNTTEFVNALDSSGITDAKVPNLGDKFPFEGEMSSNLLKNILQRAMQRGFDCIYWFMSDFLEIQAGFGIHGEHFIVKPEPSELRVLKFDKSIISKLPQHNQPTESNSFRSIYPMEVFWTTVRHFPRDVRLNVKYGHDYPMEITFKDKNGASYKFLIAPRIESD